MVTVSPLCKTWYSSRSESMAPAMHSLSQSNSWLVLVAALWPARIAWLSLWKVTAATSPLKWWPATKSLRQDPQASQFVFSTRSLVGTIIQSSLMRTVLLVLRMSRALQCRSTSLKTKATARSCTRQIKTNSKLISGARLGSSLKILRMASSSGLPWLKDISSSSWMMRSLPLVSRWSFASKVESKK